jgi:hypothetical protein
MHRDQVAQMVEVLDEAAIDAVHRQSLDNCIDLKKGVPVGLKDQRPIPDLALMGSRSGQLKRSTQALRAVPRRYQLRLARQPQRIPKGGCPEFTLPGHPFGRAPTSERPAISVTPETWTAPPARPCVHLLNGRHGRDRRA